MKIDSDLAEIIGLFIGDGCLSKWDGSSVVSFTGHGDHDYDYYDKRVRLILKNRFNIDKKIIRRNDCNAIELKYYNQEIVLFFISLGFKFGKKIDVVIPDRILDNKELISACIRGLFYADGSIYRRYTKKYNNHYRIYNRLATLEIKNQSKFLLEQIKYYLESIGIIVNKLSPYLSYWRLRITNQKSIDKFFKELSIKHPYHIKRYKDIRNIEIMGP